AEVGGALRPEVLVAQGAVGVAQLAERRLVQEQRAAGVRAAGLLVDAGARAFPGAAADVGAVAGERGGGRGLLLPQVMHADEVFAPLGAERDDVLPVRGDVRARHGDRRSAVRVAFLQDAVRPQVAVHARAAAGCRTS